jgi:hypothetical protein
VVGKLLPTGGVGGRRAAGSEPLGRLGGGRRLAKVEEEVGGLGSFVVVLPVATVALVLLLLLLLLLLMLLQWVPLLLLIYLLALLLLLLLELLQWLYVAKICRAVGQGRVAGAVDIVEGLLDEVGDVERLLVILLCLRLRLCLWDRRGLRLGLRRPAGLALALVLALVMV